MDKQFAANHFADDKYYLKKMDYLLDSFPGTSPPQFPSKLLDHVYLGNQDNADNVDLLRALEITHVLNCCGTRTFDLTRSPYKEGVGIKGYLMIPAEDYEEFDIMTYFVDAIGFLDKVKMSGGKALVHCTYGVNRSGAMVAAYLMVNERRRLLNVIEDLKAKRSLVLSNRGFRKQLIRFARCLNLLDLIDPSLLPKKISTASTTTGQEVNKQSPNNEREKNNNDPPKKEAADINANYYATYCLWKSKFLLDNSNNEVSKCPPGGSSRNNFSKYRSTSLQSLVSESSDDEKDSSDNSSVSTYQTFSTKSYQGKTLSALERRSQMFLPPEYTTNGAKTGSNSSTSSGYSYKTSESNRRIPDLISAESRRLLAEEKNADDRRRRTSDKQREYKSGTDSNYNSTRNGNVGYYNTAKNGDVTYHDTSRNGDVSNWEKCKRLAGVTVPLKPDSPKPNPKSEYSRTRRPPYKWVSK